MWVWDGRVVTSLVGQSRHIGNKTKHIWLFYQLSVEVGNYSINVKRNLMKKIGASSLQGSHK
jgi:hypothetical protein